MSAAGQVVVDALVVLGMVVVLPLGLRLLGPDVVPSPRSPLWPLAGAAGAASLLAPRGPVAVVLAAGFAAATAVLLASGARLVVRRAPAVRAVRAEARAHPSAGTTRGVDVAVRTAAAAALVLPAVGASALVAERAGWGLLGFSGTYLALTVPHMLYAGFGAALVAGTVAALARRGDRPDPLAVVGAWGVPAGTALVLVGYFVGDAAELVGAVALALALWATAWAVLRSLVRDGTAPRPARALLAVAAVSVAASMVLAVWWALGEATGLPHPGLDLMAATHGVANAVGFVLCSLLAARLLDRHAPDRAVASPVRARHGVPPRREETA